VLFSGLRFVGSLPERRAQPFSLHHLLLAQSRDIVVGVAELFQNLITALAEERRAVSASSISRTCSSGSTCTQLFAWFGGDVIKVEKTTG
jgi:hypothetical protein